jgi:O-antigen/teichoic acid export membrane protein
MFANYYAVLQPAFVHLHAKDDTIRVKNMIVNSTYIVVLVLWVILLCVATFFSELLTAWLGANTYTTYRLWGCLAMLNVFISALYGSIFRYLFVTGETKLLFGVDAVAVIINVFISILFTYLFDWYGVIIGTTVQMLILLLILNRHAKRRLQVAVFENITPTVIYFFLFSVIISAAIYWIHGTVEAPWGYLLLLQCCLLSISCFLVLKKEKLLHNLT